MAAGRCWSNGHGKVLIGKRHARISGYMFEAALEAGLSSGCGYPDMLGRCRCRHCLSSDAHCTATAGIVISASHNPHETTASSSSRRRQQAADKVEEQIEAELEKPMTTVSSGELGKRQAARRCARGRYISSARVRYRRSTPVA